MKVSKRHIWLLSIAGTLALSLFQACRKPQAFDPEMADGRLTADIQTIFDESSAAYGHAFPHMSGVGEYLHALGDMGFSQTFVTSPARIHQGLGPLYISNSCISCHGNDGRGNPPLNGEEPVALLFRLSIPGQDAHGGPNPVPGFGGQLQTHAALGKQAEGKILVNYIEQTYSYPDGNKYSLRSPSYTLYNTYQPITPGYMLSPRLAPQVYGLGFLENVQEASILEYADPNDANGDGISGRANYVWNPETHSQAIGRFGWKANTATLKAQTAGALNEDMGITSRLLSRENAYGQVQDDKIVDDPELPDSMFDAISFYVRSLSVPARRNLSDTKVINGKALFYQAKCNACHRPQMKTDVNILFPEISYKTIYPYTDLLLHDMGSGLADNRPDYLANGQEWKTPPLWGLGLLERVNGHTFFMHDGRARSIEEAILWHGGEAENAKNSFRNMSKSERDALIKFVESL